MASSTYLNPVYKNSVNQRFREKRFKFFLELLNRVKTTDRPIRILDIGGLEIYWERMNYLGTHDIHITLLNLEQKETKSPNVRSVKGNATDLSEYKDHEFDIVFSNSVIEHLYEKGNHRKMAKEAARVGKYYYIQTPNYYFPIEPHWLFPAFQWLPFSTRVWLTRKFDLGHYKKIPNRAAAEHLVSEINLITEAEMKEMFPDGKVYREYFMGMKKSITMYRFPE
ncbi:MAG: class I SAM-dependent methyltransferase [Chitinophagaceae bacterium]|nr:class I SAM-dependent methyltransferase [Chitinophagaceae bacterium]